MQNVFDFRNALIEEYGRFSRSFTRIASQDISKKVELSYSEGRYWPEPLIQINPNYKRSSTVHELVRQKELHEKCSDIFQTGKKRGTERIFKFIIPTRWKLSLWLVRIRAML